jgi:iron(III) transport system substrate-binding protein
LLVGLLLAACLGPAARPQAQSPQNLYQELSKLSFEERQSKLEQGARAEGKVVVYYDGLERLTTAMVDGFKREYPFVEVEVATLGSEEVGEKILTESAAGQHLVDVFRTSPGYFVLLEKQGLVARHYSPVPQREGLSNRFWGESWGNVQLIESAIAWNTRLVSDDQAPKSYEDFLDPKWKGKIGISQNPDDLVMSLIVRYGHQWAENWLKGLVANDVQVRGSGFSFVELLVSGEVQLSPQVYLLRLEQVKGQGAPVAWRLADPVGVPPSTLAIHARAPHPHAAALFYDFVVSRKGGEAMLSSRPGATTPVHPQLLDQAPYPSGRDVLASPYLLVLNPTNVTPELTDQTTKLVKQFITARIRQ